MFAKGMTAHIVCMTVHKVGLAMRLIGPAMHMLGWGLYDIIRKECIHGGTGGADDITCCAHEITVGA